MSNFLKEFGDFYFSESTSNGSRLIGKPSTLKFIKKHKNECSVYVLRCWNEFEEFYKVGITNYKINQRYSTNKSMPYNFEIKYEHLCSLDLGLLLELAIHDIYPRHQPKLHFGGHTECYEINEKIIKHIQDSIRIVYPLKKECDAYKYFNSLL